MSPANLTQWSGLATILAGAMLFISDVLEMVILNFDNAGTTTAKSAHVFLAGLFLLSALLFSLGLVGLYARQTEAAGALGLLGFLAAFTGTTLVAGAFLAQEFFVLAVAEIPPGFLYNDRPHRLGLVFSYHFQSLPSGGCCLGRLH